MCPRLSPGRFCFSRRARSSGPTGAPARPNPPRTKSPASGAGWSKAFASEESVCRPGSASTGNSGINPLDHYLLYGSKEGRWKSQKHKEKTGFFRKMERFLRRQRKRFIARINFDREWYLRQYPELRGTQVDLIEHYLTTGTAQDRSKSEREKEKNFLKILPYLENTHGESCADRIKNIYHLFLLDKKRPKASGVFLKKRPDSVTMLMEELAVSVRKHRQKLCLPPRASIIIPMYEQVLYTLGCLVALIESDAQVPFEIIVADDCSSPATRKLLQSLPVPIRISISRTNQGFVRNCNQAARLARGEFLVFLNNDMLVLPGWLDNLIETFELHPRCGIAGSKLLNYDGTLQEAGGIFWKDGSAWNYGRGSDPDLPEFNYCRTVDYCSGASICLRKRDWDEMGGFDEMYERAYCEDADLSFRMRRDKGLDTFYNPFSVGIHLEGVSSGTDTRTGEKAYQVVNQKKFFSRWKRTLEAEHESNGGNVFKARGRTRQRKTVLIADHYIPEEDKDAGSRTMSQITRLFLKNNADVVLWPQNLNYIKKYAQGFQKAGVQVIYNTNRNLQLSQWLSENKKYIHSYFIARPQVLEDFLKIIDPTTSKIFFYGMDVHHLRLESQLKNDPDNEKLRQEKNHWEKTEKKLWKKVSFLLYPSKNETKYISDFLKNKRKNFEVRTMPVFYWESFTDKKSLTVKNRTGLFYVAGFSHPPNVEGILWFVDKVFPLVLQKMPNCILKIAGSNLPAQVENLKNKNIQILGYISEKQLKLNYLNTRVAIAPLLSGAGMKGKVAEALRHGVPMVTTSFGAQGFEDGKGVVAAFNDLHGMAEKILELLRDENKWLAAATQSVKLAQKMFSEKNMWNTIKELIE
ncbi:MAG: glycosyltransferase [Verrucomicrobia bacterium]|nr:glycosyltransferase [Verrucomicrobiota bacterium]